MRAVLAGDVDQAARAALYVAPRLRPAFLRALFDGAHAADRLRKRTGRGHPRWGNGSLAAAASACRQIAPVSRYDSAWCDGVAAVVQALSAWRGDMSRRPRPSERTHIPAVDRRHRGIVVCWRCETG